MTALRVITVRAETIWKQTILPLLLLALVSRPQIGANWMRLQEVKDASEAVKQRLLLWNPTLRLLRETGSGVWVGHFH